MARSQVQQDWPMGYQNFHHQDALPPVYHNEFMIHTKLVYPGREQTYTWYLQLKSNAQQYGIYLCEMDEFKKDKSLCPSEIYGIAIPPPWYHEMK